MHIWTSFFCWGFFFTFYFLSFSSFCFFHKYVILKVKWNAQYACSFICHRKSEPHFFQKNYNIISHFKDLERGKKWPHGNLMKFSKWKWKVLLPGEECLSQDRLGTSWVESSFAKEDLRISVEKKEVRQWCASIRACIRKNIGSSWGAVSPPLCPALRRCSCSVGSSPGLPTWEGHRLTGLMPPKGHKDDWGLEHLLWEKGRLRASRRGGSGRSYQSNKG